ncbi:hypothetical protein FD06_GL000359 [Apilactobacillus ozensis DSM 23829 = JCM 17196]|uniref:YhaN AAA domain-containing protein n=2 Tax=Apilactobacillus ozensis TaxID=866801 RepID=A0A0R2AXE3_9LACO|nr:AAA family ATPase [Apilactobacillus ozensis]KRM67907.1 hypothetical protein FD06_GL000359 [Apilactobacillus ozensis DSM 23829 = JCM 17196]
MIIKQLNIFGYGKWQDSTITLKSKNLNVIFGNNESGKTTLISFIKGILFGFKDGHNTYEQYIPKNTKSYGGELLVDVNNKLLKIKRIAGTHGGELSIVDNDSGETISNEKLDDIMGPINRESFDSIFYFGNFDTKAFSKISDEQLAYIIQKVGFAGSEKFIALKDDLSKRYKKLYAKNGRNPILNKKLKDYKLLLDKIEQAKQNQNEYTQLELEYNNVDKKYSLASHKLSKLNNHLKTLQGYKNNWTLFQKLKAYNSLKNKEMPIGFSIEDKKTLDNLSRSIENVDDKIENLNEQLNLNVSNKISDQNKTFKNHLSEIDDIKSEINSMEKNIINYNANISNLKSLNNQIESYSNDYSNELDAEPLHQKQVFELKSLLVNRHKLLNSNNMSTGKNNILYLVIFLISFVLMLLGFLTTKSLSLFGLVLAIIIGILYKSNQKQLKAKNEINQKVTKIDEKISFYKQQFNYKSNNPNDWIAVQPILKNYKKTLINRDQIASDKVKLKQKIDNYFDKFNKITNILDNNDEDYSNKLIKLKKYIDKNEHEISSYKNNLQHYTLLKSKQQSINSKKLVLKKQLVEFFNKRNVKNYDEFIQEYNRQENIAYNLKDLKEISKQIPDELYVSMNKYTDVDELNSDYTKLNYERKVLQDSMLALTKDKTELNSKLSIIKRDGTYSELIQKQANLESEIIHITYQWLALKLSNQWIDEMLDLATADLIPKIKERAKKYFSILTNSNYINITYYKSKLKLTRADKLKFDVGELSRGTMQQLYFAILLSMAVNFGEKYKLPIIIDDGFYEYDENRLNQAMKLIKEVSKEIQIIYCTADGKAKKSFNDDVLITI